MNIVFANIALPRSGAVAVLVAEGGALGKVGKDIDKKTGGMLARAIRADRFEGKVGQTLDILAPNGITAARVLLIGIGKPQDIKPLVAEKAGAVLVDALAKKGDKSVAVAIDEFSDAAMQVADIAAHVGAGARLASYRFDKYRTTLGERDKPSLTKVTVMCAKAPAAKTAYLPLDRVIDGVFDARDLMNEPANSLNPAEFAARAKALVKRGLKVEVLNEKQMEKLGMGALLGVGRGSACESQLIVMHWKGDPKSKEAPIAVVGKGV
ncbi:MAG TPA: leucyl aminopeptidase, partial [Alphaproteobacteria bacterium]|nr:leucyl aminopeptidase [Alphaproteobacteria bacterium]HAM48647.1 leucyl aminopeptidase [Alphaproteobacteria bacterium]